ncbi:MAG: CRISPR system precrRNA processing endoribonuclease RAMP protein Cas6 [Methylobacteriaceae bacterium]|jgi:hypothetical protein|nr:CRISPR system precrRNA processing endoribonuclease RAMP protein Cas6 [Methylobacteriaceae bacterium]
MMKDVLMSHGDDGGPPQGWPVVRYRFVFETETLIHLPDYAGSMLRGAFGRALRRTACMTREPDCRGCPLYATCPYAAIFEAPPPAAHALQNFSNIPNPYVIEPPPWGRRLYQPGEAIVFHMVLFGQALNKLALVVYAWQRAFQYEVGGGTAALVDVVRVGPDGEEAVFDTLKGRMRDHEQTLPLPQTAPGGEVRLAVLTPLRLQNNGRALEPEEMTARVFLMALVRRLSLLAEFHAGFVPGYPFREMGELAAGVSFAGALKWVYWERYSSRQQRKMTPNGLVGTVRLSGVPEMFGLPLYLGQWLHVGKNATFGLGGYTLEDGP